MCLVCFPYFLALQEPGLPQLVGYLKRAYGQLLSTFALELIASLI